MTDTPSNSDDLKGRIKEGAGAVTGDDDLKREGKIDQATGTIKDKIDGAVDKVKDALDGDDKPAR